MAIDANRVTLLESGTAETTNLAECLAINQAVLACTVLSQMGIPKKQINVVKKIAQDTKKDGISKEILAVSMAIGECIEGDTALLRHLSEHTSDTVRSWAAFISARKYDTAHLKNRLTTIQPYAADVHFGVREWAWMAVRPYIAADVVESIKILIPWTRHKDPNVRRFAVESIRPRGVWCEHIKVLKEEPEMAEKLLEELKADSSRYVQDSVANWLNDASKTRPEWVVHLCADWSKDKNEHTDRIIKRALRTVMKKAASASGK